MNSKDQNYYQPPEQVSLIRQRNTPVDLALGQKMIRAALTLATLKTAHARSTSLDLVELSLEDEELWNEFNVVTNEMIITKLGRCLFPTIKISLRGLNPNLLYAVAIDFVMVGYGKYKFKGARKGWFNSSTNHSLETIDDEICDYLRKMPIYEIHEYFDSPKKGDYWNKNVISFSKLKLTNKFQSSVKSSTEFIAENGNSFAEDDSVVGYNSEGVFSLHSFHKYIPRIHVMHVTPEYSRRIQKQTILGIKTFVFPQTSFIAVTHYQNNAVNILKKNYNPHAKGFKDNSSLGNSSQSSQSSFHVCKSFDVKSYKQSSSDTDYYSTEESEE